MLRLFYLARYINAEVGGGLLRLKQIELLRQSGFKVILILPNYESDATIVEEDCVRIPTKENVRMGLLKEHLGLADDYLDRWQEEAFKYLADKVSAADLIFASASGELSCLKLASRLKTACQSRYIANLHDPLDYSKINGRRFGDRIHASREKSERKYLQNADLIITSSQTYREVLSAKYPEIAARTLNSYFGYREKIVLRSKQPGTRLRIAYGGSYQTTQSPEILAKAAHGLDSVEMYFIGNQEHYEPIQKFKNDAILVPSMAHEAYLNFMMENIDVGFVSLARDFLSVCVPSKIFEYLNLGLPMIGALPEGDAKDLINNRKYGLAAHFADVESIRRNIVSMCDPANQQQFQQNVMRERDSWEMNCQFTKIIDLLRKMA